MAICRLAGPALLALMALALVACSTGSGTVAGCHSNSDCKAGFGCNETTGACQILAGCSDSLMCPSGTFCDTASGNCIDNSHCTEDVQCPFGQICDTLTFACRTGCRGSGDCTLGQVCHCGDGTSPDQDGGSCIVGTCVSGFCDNLTDCDYGDLCEVPDGGSGPSVCVKDTRGPYCGGCTIGPGDMSQCGGAANFCLLDRKVSFSMTYCGIDCSHGQACPFGYDCQNVVILTKGLCQVDADCPTTGGPCQSNTDCEGARCDLDAGRCAGACQYNEDSLQGFCTCTNDNDCPTDSCSVTTRTCSISQQPCTLEGNECAHAIFCSRSPGIAACYIGANCKPSLGLTCQETLLGTPIQ